MTSGTPVHPSAYSLSALTKTMREMKLPDHELTALAANFSKLDTGTVEYLDNALTEEHLNEPIVHLILAKALILDDHPVLIDDIAYYLLHASDDHLRREVLPRFRWMDETPVQYHPVRTDLTGLGYYYQLERYGYRKGTPLRLQPETVRNQCNALLRLHEYAHSIYGNFAFDYQNPPFVHVTANNRIEPVQLAQLAIDTPERVEDIIRTIDAHQAVDIHLVTEVVESETPALSEGML